MQQNDNFHCDLFRSARQEGFCRLSKFFMTLLILGGILCASGCGTQPQVVVPASPKPLEGVTLKYFCSDPALRPLIDQIGKVWGNNSGASLTTGTEEDADVLFLSPAEMPRFAEAGQLQPMPEVWVDTGSEFQAFSLLHSYRRNTLVWNSSLHAVPVVGEGLVSVWNTEKIKSAPQTWEDVLEAAKIAGPESLPPLPDRPESFDREFFSIAAPYDRPSLTDSDLGGKLAEAEVRQWLFSFQHHLDTGDVRLDSASFRHAYSLMSRMQAFRPAKPGNPAESFRQGKAIFALVTLADVARFAASDSPVREKFEVAPVPGSYFYFDHETGMKVDIKPVGAVNRIPYLGTSGLVGVVHKRCGNIEAAFDWLLEISGPSQSPLETIGHAKWGAGPFRNFHLDPKNHSYWMNYELAPEATQRLIGALRELVGSPRINPAFRIRFPNQNKYVQLTDTELKAALTKGTSAEEALGRLSETWNKLDAELDPRGGNNRLLRMLRLSEGQSE
jgi:hypothetical protein